MALGVGNCYDPRMRALGITAAAFAILALSGCGGSADKTDLAPTTAPAPVVQTTAPAPVVTPSPEPPADSADAVDWSLIPRGDNLRAFIAEDIAAGNCENLQGFFDTWDEADIDTGAKADLLVYLDASMKQVGCY